MAPLVAPPATVVVLGDRALVVAEVHGERPEFGCFVFAVAVGGGTFCICDAFTV
jgi:hypothetical protein